MLVIKTIMQHASIFVLFAFLIFAFSSLSFGAKYKGVGISNGGTISGKISFSGKVPAPKVVKVTKDQSVCGSTKVSDALVVSSKGGVLNAVVALEGVKKGKKWDFSKTTSYGQKGCMFSPRVIILRPKSVVEVGNGDKVKHNFHAISKGVFSTNKMMSPGKKIKVKKGKIRRAGLVRVKCDLHDWMGGYWYVAKTPYTVLTDNEGNFSITDVPAGKFKLTVWHETLGKVSKTVVVTAGGSSNVNIKMSQ